ncbi:hypothetical protein EVAR_62830_1 [Eumeta japonica]|uniref:Uncharacterized protein n=1 Tax=Eumeta variegata TaxID=151549 RepID=A0A4C2A8G4_EUMVA|nr:hypothetical protein EVAR_62830_1 [Eumeta japonica]
MRFNDDQCSHRNVSGRWVSLNCRSIDLKQKDEEKERKDPFVVSKRPLLLLRRNVKMRIREAYTMTKRTGFTDEPSRGPATRGARSSPCTGRRFALNRLKISST